MTHISNKGRSRIGIGKRHIGADDPVFFIAEIGNNHNGDYYLAKRLIEKSAEAGADAVKFQKRFIDEVFTKELQSRPQVKDNIFGKTYGEYRQALELDMPAFLKLKKTAENLGLVFFVTPFDHKSADFIEQIGVDLYKIASFDVTNLPLLEHVAKKGKPIVLSTGMSSLEELDWAIEIITRYNDQLVILHCVSIYPSDDNRLNLATIPFLRERYNPIPVGYSGHEKGFIPTLAAISLGAKCVERHITLDKSMPGPDHGTVSVDTGEFAEMIRQGRRIESMLGKPEKVVFDAEMPVRDKHSKSLVTKVAIPANTVITREMITCKSPGHGLKPILLPKVIGVKTRRDLSEDCVITAEDVDF